MQLVIGLLIPFLGTTLGSAMVFLMKNKINKKFPRENFTNESGRYKLKVICLDILC